MMILYKRYIKRFLDIIFSFIGLILLFPFLFIIAITTRLTSKGSAVFRQKRIGRNKKYFYIYKFRTMKITTPSDCPTHLLENPDEYITSFGHFLRCASLDELPQLFNILKGDMSIVGPRPALWNQYDLIAERDKYGVNELRPGLTGWAQINGRDALTIPSKAKLDSEYLENLSLSFDVKCFAETFLVVARRKGVVEGSHIPELNDIGIYNQTAESGSVELNTSKETTLK